MKLYYAPGACALAPHIAIAEAGLKVELVKVEFGAGTRTAGGRDFYTINPQGAVPALELDSGDVLTENAVLLQYIAAQKSSANLAPSGGDMARWHFLETLNFIATELHKGFSPLFGKLSDEARQATIEKLTNRFGLLARKLGDNSYLAGLHFTVADAYAFVMLRWAEKFSVDISGLPTLGAYFARLRQRPSVRQALQEEGLPV